MTESLLITTEILPQRGRGTSGVGGGAFAPLRAFGGPLPAGEVLGEVFGDGVNGVTQ
jgi:hypothetical protein